jgi:hypothetical protein
MGPKTPKSCFQVRGTFRQGPIEQKEWKRKNSLFRVLGQNLPEPSPGSRMRSKVVLFMFPTCWDVPEPKWGP